jgi:hypothetical protein
MRRPAEIDPPRAPDDVDDVSTGHVLSNRVGPFLAWLSTEHYGDLASVVGLLISLVGFAVTIIATLRAKSAADMAREAVDRVRVIEVRTSTIESCATAIALMDEIRRLHRGRSWSHLPELYSQVRRLLIAISGNDRQITALQRSELRAVIEQFATLEEQLERILAGKANGSPEKLNGVVAKQLDRVHEVLVAVRSNPRV